MEETALQNAIMNAVNESMDFTGGIVRNAADGFLMILKPQEDIASGIINNPLCGTLYYWQVDISKLKGVREC